MKKSCLIRGLSLLIFFLFIVSCDKEEDVLPGHINKNTIWSGNVVLTGDVFVEKGVTLTILPGTIITVMADQDDTKQSQIAEPDDLTTGDPTNDPKAGGDEYHKTHIAINIIGKIICKGTAEQPIVFKSSKPEPHYTDWIGIVANDAEFEYTLIEWCLNGLYSGVGSEKFTVDNCHVRHIWAAGIGFQPPANSSVQYFVKHTTIEDCGHEGIDTHSPGNIEFAYNIIKDSQVGLNLHDNITANIHHNIILNTTFPVICVNSTNVFVTQCVFQASIQENSRWSYQGWTIPQFQDAAGLFVTNSTKSNVIVTNSIIFDSPTGLRNEAPEASLVNGYLNMDNVSAPYMNNCSEGSGCLKINSGFLDKAGSDFHLQSDSPLKGAGNPADGSPDLGVYGGTIDVIGCSSL